MGGKARSRVVASGNGSSREPGGDSSRVEASGGNEGAEGSTGDRIHEKAATVVKDVGFGSHAADVAHAAAQAKAAAITKAAVAAQGAEEAPGGAGEGQAGKSGQLASGARDTAGQVAAVTAEATRQVRLTWALVLAQSCFLPLAQSYFRPLLLLLPPDTLSPVPVRGGWNKTTKPFLSLTLQRPACPVGWRIHGGGR